MMLFLGSKAAWPGMWRFQFDGLKRRRSTYGHEAVRATTWTTIRQGTLIFRFVGPQGADQLGGRDARPVPQNHSHSVPATDRFAAAPIIHGRDQILPQRHDTVSARLHRGWLQIEDVGRQQNARPPPASQQPSSSWGGRQRPIGRRPSYLSSPPDDPRLSLVQAREGRQCSRLL